MKFESYSVRSFPQVFKPKHGLAMQDHTHILYLVQNIIQYKVISKQTQ